MKYTAAQIDSPWEPDMWEDFAKWFAAAGEAAEYRHLSFDEELTEARAASKKNNKEETRW
jgi:hypothetical protein